jgi:predicted RNA methylase
MNMVGPLQATIFIIMLILIAILIYQYAASAEVGPGRYDGGALGAVVGNMKSNNIYTKNTLPSIDWFFPPTTSSHQLQIDKESVYSITSPKQMRPILNLAREITDSDLSGLTITDATANVGGSTLGFLPFVKAINSVEMNPQKFEMLQNNVNIYPGSEKVRFILSDFTSIMSSLKQDLVFVDPPWGGMSYKNAKNINLKLGEMDMGQIAVKLFDNAAPVYIIYKLPKNYDMRVFDKMGTLGHSMKVVSAKHFLLVAIWKK